ncbi:MAG: hypothetical protein H0X25_15510 [Acidobacteriales bacterium]|nr:hypothetical protein [Terriglobales bacterium]
MTSDRAFLDPEEQARKQHATETLSGVAGLIGIAAEELLDLLDAGLSAGDLAKLLAKSLGADETQPS